MKKTAPVSIENTIDKVIEHADRSNQFRIIATFFIAMSAFLFGNTIGAFLRIIFNSRISDISSTSISYLTLFGAMASMTSLVSNFYFQNATLESNLSENTSRSIREDGKIARDAIDKAMQDRHEFLLNALPHITRELRGDATDFLRAKAIILAGLVTSRFIEVSDGSVLIREAARVRVPDGFRIYLDYLVDNAVWAVEVDREKNAEALRHLLRVLPPIDQFALLAWGAEVRSLADTQWAHAQKWFLSSSAAIQRGSAYVD